MTGWLRIPKQAADYCSVSERTFEGWLHGGLRFVKAGGCRLTKPEFIDQFLLQYESSQDHVKTIVDEVMKSI